MAYSKTTWAAGNTITSVGLNNIEKQLELLNGGTLTSANTNYAVDGIVFKDSSNSKYYKLTCQDGALTVTEVSI